MTTVGDIIGYVEKLTGHRLNFDEGVQHGEDRAVTSALVSWAPNPEAIEAAGKNGHQLLISHECLYYPYDVQVSKDQQPGWEDWKINRQRREALDKHGLTFLRIHGSADDISVLDDFASMLQLSKPVFVKGWVKIYEIKPCTLAQLVEHVKGCVGMEHLRVSPAGPLDRIVKRVGMPWGGLGLVANVLYQQYLVEQNCDVFIAGETDNYGMRFAEECGIPMIETSHETSENPGMRRLADMLAKAFPDVKFEFLENPRVWEFM